MRFFGVQNSNSTIASVLNSVGIDINSNLPTGTFASTFPGINNLLDFDTNLEGTSDDDTIRGGSNNDTLTGNGGNDIINGGEGLDTFIYSGSFDDYQIELSPGGIAHITDNIENRDGSDGLIGIEIVQFSDGSIDLRDGDFLFPPAPYAEEAEDGLEEAEAQVWQPPSCPLILDLDGDGIELTSLEDSTVHFDLDGDGFREKTGWLKSDDGLLVLDRNNDDGYINDISELFGNQTTGGFTELQVLDSNNDGQITSADNDFSNLQVWRDLDGDGHSDIQELFSLSELNIAKIDAVGTSVSRTNAGHLIDETGSFELADGTQREVANVWFNLHQIDSYYDHYSTFNSPVIITEQILNLPNLKGYGELPDLRIAVAQDSELLNLVESFSTNVAQGDITTARQLMRPLMYHWAGVAEVDPSNLFPNADINTQELRFLEAFVGRSWNNGNPSFAGGVTLTDTYERLQGDLETRLLVQLTESPVEYNTVSETYEFSGSLDEAVEQFEQVIAQYQNSSSETLDIQALALAQYIQQESEEPADWVLGDILDETLTGTTTDNKLFGLLGNDSLAGGTGNDIYYGGSGNDTISESSQSSDIDTLSGGTGNDSLLGAGGDDVYIFNKGDDSDVISDSTIVTRYASLPTTGSGGANDELIFGNGITRSNLDWNFDGSDLIFSLTDSVEDRLTIKNYTNLNYRIENIEVEGSSLTPQEIISLKTWEDTSNNNYLSWLEGEISYRGLDGNDNIITGNYSDKLWGGDGNDSLNSGDGDDTLDGGAGDDTLSAGNGNNYLVAGSGNDTLRAGSGEDILSGQDGNDSLAGGTGNDIYYGGTGNDIFSESSQSSDRDTLDGGAGDDTLRGGGGNDTYVFDRGYHSDIISDSAIRTRYASLPLTVSGGESDTLIFGDGVTRDNLRWNFDGNDLIFTLTDSPDDSLTILNYADSNYVIENIELDGSLLTTEEILNPQFNEQPTSTIGEFGKVSSFNHNSQTIEFDNSYDNPVVFALPLSLNGGDPTTVRITDLQSDRFTAYLQEAEYKDGQHTNESFSYLVVESGTWELEDGTLLEVGTEDTNLLTTDGWSELDFNVDFAHTPVILSQVQTDNDPQFVRTRQKQASVDGFSLSMEEEEALNNSGHATETVGWLAIESGQGNWGELEYQAGHTGNSVNHQGYDLNFSQDFSNEPHLLASLASFNGSDSAGLRYQNLSDTSVRIIVEEERSFDPEITHVNEIVDFIAVSGTGDLTATAYEAVEMI